jgi:hypothetical protein
VLSCDLPERKWERISQAHGGQAGTSLRGGGFAVSPFTETDYTIEFSAGLWQWGGLDVAGSAGYSARVSFDSTGATQIEVFYSTDRIVPRH